MLDTQTLQLLKDTDQIHDLDPYFNNMNVSPFILGMQQQAVPFLQFISSQRSSMFSAHFAQACVIRGAEMPYIYTGAEFQFGKYELNTTRVDQPYIVLAVIPKYLVQYGMYRIHETPTYLVIYRGLNDNQIGSFELSKYTKLHNGYGYLNKLDKMNMLTANAIIPENTEFYTSPAKSGINRYMLGTNLNTCFMTLDEVDKDAFVASVDAAKKLCSSSIESLWIKIDPSQNPLNCYGNEEEFKFIPDIGQTVREDGIICGLRKPTDASIISDTTQEALCTPQELHDKLYRVKPGSVVLDIDVYVNFNDKRIKASTKEWSQVKKYVDSISKYYQRIIEVYDSVSKDPSTTITGTFNTQVFRAMMFRLAEGHRVPGVNHNKESINFLKEKDPIDFISIKITYLSDYEISLGAKLAGRDGCKGTTCAIWANEDMPVDELGIRADLIYDPIANLNRMIGSPLYETWINRVAWFVRNQALEMESSGNTGGAVDHILKFFRMVNPNYGELVGSKLITELDKLEFMDAVKKEPALYINIPPFLSTIGRQMIKDITKEFGVYKTPVSYNLRDSEGNLIRRVTTKKAIAIGSKYVYLLYKIPRVTSPGFGFVNQFRTPEKPSSHSRDRHPINQTPIRFGEDEYRNFVMTVGPEIATRLMALHANSPIAVDRVMNTIINAEQPSNIKGMDITTDEAVETNAIINVIRHMFSTCGVELTNKRSKAVEYAKANLSRYLSPQVRD